MTLIDLTKDSDLPNLKALRELYDRHFEDTICNNNSFEEVYLSSFGVACLGINVNYFWTKLCDDNINMNVWILIKNLNIKLKPDIMITESMIFEVEMAYKAELEHKMINLVNKYSNIQANKQCKVNLNSQSSCTVNIWMSLYKRNISYSWITENIRKTLLDNVSLKKCSSMQVKILICDNVLGGCRLISYNEQRSFYKIFYVLNMELPKLQRINKRIMPVVLKLRNVQNAISKYAHYDEKIGSTEEDTKKIILEEDLLNFVTSELKKVINLSKINIKNDLNKKEIPKYLKETENKYNIFVNVEKDELYQKKLKISKIYRENNDEEDD